MAHPAASVPSVPSGHQAAIDKTPPAGGNPTSPPGATRHTYAAIDLGTNNCRLLVARPITGGFIVVDAFSRIVRLGEGLAQSGRLSAEAMDRAVDALGVCADKLRRRRVSLARSVATEACRRAANGRDFIERVRAETGLALEIIAPQEEARLAVLGCHKLLGPGDGPALIFDIGGGSTELEMLPRDAPNIRLLGTSGTVTTLASVHLALPSYDRRAVDGLHVPIGAMREISTAIARMDLAERSALPCIGAERADLVVAGCAILEAILDIWPAEQLGVADRGIREGILRSLMARDGYVL